MGNVENEYPLYHIFPLRNYGRYKRRFARTRTLRYAGGDYSAGRVRTARFLGVADLPIAADNG